VGYQDAVKNKMLPGKPESIVEAKIVDAAKAT